MKITRPRYELSKQGRPIYEALRNNMRYTFLTLQFASNLQQFRFNQRPPLLAANTFPDNDIDLAALVLERQKRHPVRTLWALPHEHDPRGTDDLSMCNATKIARRQ